MTVVMSTSVAGHRRGVVALLAVAATAVMVLAAPPADAAQRVPTGLGPTWAAKVAGHAQVVVASGAGWTSTHTTVTEWQRTSGGWVKLATWKGWTGLAGWTTKPSEYRRQTPVGVFGLTDAGGYAPDPGSRLPYHRSTRDFWLISHKVRTFNHVIAINYNRVPGTSPANRKRPHGFAAGGGFWIHTQHHSGTGGCVTISDAGVVHLQRTLTPSLHPVIVMGPASVLRR
jgi:L,D-peptidoglycan transpeptidase YkuD (ErfK/YbiS/YcfS/YnhG family)